MTRPDLQTRILQVLEEHGAQPARDMPHWLSGTDAIAIDCGLSALLRANKVKISGTGCYTLVKPTARIHVDAPEIPRRMVMASPPTAAEELAANLQPTILVCARCCIPKPECDFQLLTNGARLKTCHVCHGERAREGRRQAKERREAAAVRVETNGTEALKVAQQTVNLPGTPPTAGSIPAGSTSFDIAQSVERLPVTKDVPGSSAGVAANSPQPVIAEHIFERVKAQRQGSLNRIALLEVDLANERARMQECEEFVRLYQRFAEGGT